MDIIERAMTEKRKFKHPEAVRKYWREQKRKYRAKKKAQQNKEVS